jgi:hypothetical protein
MFEYFPGNYVWNLGVVAALNSGGLIDEVDRACRPIRDRAAQGSDVGTREFMASWTAVVDGPRGQAAADERPGTGGPPAESTCRAYQLPHPGRAMQSATRPEAAGACISAASYHHAEAVALIDPRARPGWRCPFEGGLCLPAVLHPRPGWPRIRADHVERLGLDQGAHVRLRAFLHELRARILHS